MSNPVKDLGPIRAKSLLQNWMSQLGLLLAICGFVAGLALLAIDFLRGFTNPYLGVLTHAIVPLTVLIGLLLLAIGMIRERRRCGLSPD